VIADVVGYASTRHGVLSAAELSALGISIDQREHLVTHGLLVGVHRGVWAVAALPTSLPARCRAISLADGRAFVTGRAAGALWELRRVGRPDPIEVRVPHFAHSLAGPGIRLRRCNALDPRDVVVRPDGIRLASPPRLAFDLAAVLPALDLESVVEQMVDRRWCTIPTLIDTGRRLAHPARPGSTRFVQVLGSRPAWLAPVDSHLELLLFDALRRAGVAELARQHRLELPGGWAIHGDIAVPRLRWLIAVDHVTWHGGRVDAQRDKQNDRQAGVLGWRVDRVTDEDLQRRFDATVDELLAIHRRLRQEVAS